MAPLKQVLVAKISLKTILTSFLCFPPSGDKAMPCALHRPVSFALLPWGTGQVKHGVSGKGIIFALQA